jgi:hypothetical protein
MLKSKFKNLAEWKAYDNKAYLAAYKNGVLSEICEMFNWERYPKKWTLELCKEEALKYNTKRDWKRYQQGSYEYARSNGWLDECCCHMIELNKPSGYWNEKTCIESALKFTTLKEWTKAFPSAVAKSRQLGIREKCTAHMVVRKITMPKKVKPSGYWAKETFIKECSLYSNFFELKNNNPSSVECARSGGYLDEVLEFLGWEKRKTLGRKVTKWTKEMCLEDALKYTTKVEWEKNSVNCYSAARRNGWYEECSKHMVVLCRNKNYWTKERCIKDALNYNTKIAWKLSLKSGYNAASKNGWLDECCGHMISNSKPAGYWTKERCMEEALKHSKLMDWRNNNQTSHNAAKRNGWFEECTKHMSIQKRNQIWDKEKCIKEALKYSRFMDWRNNGGGSISAARKNGWYEECTKHMKKYGKRV